MYLQQRNWILIKDADGDTFVDVCLIKVNHQFVWQNT